MLEWLRNPNPIKAVILAGGRGSRLAPITDKNHKVLIDVGGKPVIEYVIDNLKKHYINQIYVSLYHQADKIIPYIEKKAHYHIQEKDRGTAQAVKAFETKLSEPFVVCNGDTISEVDITQLIKGHYLMNSKATVFTHKDEYENGGTYVFSKEALEYIPDNKYFSINEWFKELKKIPPSVTLSFQDKLYWDIGTPKGLRKAKIYYEKFN